MGGVFLFRYAQIYKGEDGYGYIMCDSLLSGEVEAENMIPISEDFEISRERWNYVISDWETYEPEPGPELQPPKQTQADRIEESQLVIMEAIAEQYEQHQAERLADMEVQATTYEAILELQKGGKV